MKNFLSRIPAWLSSNVSIFIFLFLFVYLVLLGIAGLFSDWVRAHLAPDADMQLMLGNYTNVTSALGAAIAAGASTAAHTTLKKLHLRHGELKKAVDDLHVKIDKLSVNVDTPPANKAAN